MLTQFTDAYMWHYGDMSELKGRGVSEYFPTDFTTNQSFS